MSMDAKTLKGHIEELRTIGAHPWRARQVRIGSRKPQQDRLAPRALCQSRRSLLAKPSMRACCMRCGLRPEFRLNSSMPSSVSRLSDPSKPAPLCNGSRFNEKSKRPDYRSLAPRSSGSGFSKCRGKVWRRPGHHDGHQSLVSGALFRPQAPYRAADDGSTLHPDHRGYLRCRRCEPRHSNH